MLGISRAARLSPDGRRNRILARRACGRARTKARRDRPPPTPSRDRRDRRREVPHRSPARRGAGWASCTRRITPSSAPLRDQVPAAASSPSARHPEPVPERGRGGGRRSSTTTWRPPTDFGIAADGAPYIVMEYLVGENCADAARARGPLPVPRAADLVAQACRGRRGRARGRDRPPRSQARRTCSWPDAATARDLLKVLDFGIAKLQALDEASVGDAARARSLGTACYMSPEQARGAGEVDAAHRRLVAGRRALRAARGPEAVRGRAVPAASSTRS